MVTRRVFLGSLASGLLAAPLAAEAQQVGKVPRIGYLVLGPLDAPESRMGLAAFRQALRERGYLEGQNIVIEYRAADGKIERLPALAAELVRLNVDLIVAGSTLLARAARQATTTIPIVAGAMGDPVGDGLVVSLSRPGGNITGLTFLGPELVSKRLGLLKEVLPKVSRVAVLWHPGAFGETTMSEMRKEMEVTARNLRVDLRIVEVRGPDDLDRAFAAIAREHADSLFQGPSAMLFAERRQIVALGQKPAALDVQREGVR